MTADIFFPSLSMFRIAGKIWPLQLMPFPILKGRKGRGQGEKERPKRSAWVCNKRKDRRASAGAGAGSPGPRPSIYLQHERARVLT